MCTGSRYTYLAGLFFSFDALGEASGQAKEPHMARTAGDPELLRVVSGQHQARN